MLIPIELTRGIFLVSTSTASSKGSNAYRLEVISDVLITMYPSTPSAAWIYNYTPSRGL